MPPPNSSYDAFLRSMTITPEKWRDGVGYDLDALHGVSDSERTSLVDTLANRLAAQPDWRDIEALGAIDTPAARQILRDAAGRLAPGLRMECVLQLQALGEPVDADSAIAEAIRAGKSGQGFDKALLLAQRSPGATVRAAVLAAALDGADSTVRVACAGLAFYLAGLSSEPFDWNHRPFFLRFADDDRNTRLEAYQELCRLSQTA